jgi:hypothetical protein
MQRTLFQGVCVSMNVYVGMYVCMYVWEVVNHAENTVPRCSRLSMNVYVCMYVRM